MPIRNYFKWISQLNWLLWSILTEDKTQNFQGGEKKREKESIEMYSLSVFLKIFWKVFYILIMMSISSPVAETSSQK